MRFRLFGLSLFPLLTASPLWSVPVANPDAFTAVEGSTLTIDAADGVLKNDTGSGPLGSVLESDVSDGSLSLNADGSFTYTPDPGFSGTDTFTYRTSVTFNVLARVPLKITSITRASNGELTINFSSTPGTTYQLQYTPDLVTPFTDVEGATLSAIEPASSFTPPPGALPEAIFGSSYLCRSKRFA